MKHLQFAVFLLAALLEVTSSSYKTRYAEPNCKKYRNIAFPLGEKGESTALIIKPQRGDGYDSDNDCNISVSASKARGHVLLNVKLVDFINPFGCKNYLEIFSDGASMAKLCGNGNKDLHFSNGKAEFMKFHYRTESSSFLRAGFKIIATAYTDGPCRGNFGFPCRNDRCISGSLACDGYDNCGDGSDESYDSPAKCRLGAGVISAIVIGVLLLIALVSGIIWCCQRRRRVVKTVYQTPTPMANPIAQQSYQQQGGGIMNPNYGIPYPQQPPPYQK